MLVSCAWAFNCSSQEMETDCHLFIRSSRKIFYFQWRRFLHWAMDPRKRSHSSNGAVWLVLVPFSIHWILDTIQNHHLRALLSARSNWFWKWNLCLCVGEKNGESSLDVYWRYSEVEVICIQKPELYVESWVETCCFDCLDKAINEFLDQEAVSSLNASWTTSWWKEGYLVEWCRWMICVFLWRLWAFTKFLLNEFVDMTLIIKACNMCMMRLMMRFNVSCWSRSMQFNRRRIL